MPALPDTIERLDRAVGEELERQVRNHHRRRLRKLGHGHLLDHLQDGRRPDSLCRRARTTAPTPRAASSAG